jgi:hypothetical protein
MIPCTWGNLDFDPVSDAAGAICRTEALRHDALAAVQACSKMIAPSPSKRL